MTYMTERSPHGISAPAYRPVRMGRKGAVVANHPLAAMAGMTTLQRGGNAVDAAVAVGFALGVAEPQSSGIGGDGFVMVYMKEGRRLEVANGTGAAPLAATADFYRTVFRTTGSSAHRCRALSTPCSPHMTGTAFSIS